MKGWGYITKLPDTAQKIPRIPIGLLVLLISQPSYGEVEQARVIRAMQNLGADWQLLSSSGEVLVVGCANNTFKGIRLNPNAIVGVDLRTTTSLMNPYLGIVHVTGRFQQNSSRKDGSCSKTQLEAKSSQAFWGNDQDYDLEIYYQVNGNELWLSDGNEVFQNAFTRQSGPPLADSGSAWFKAFRFPVQ